MSKSLSGSQKTARSSDDDDDDEHHDEGNIVRFNNV